MTNECAIALLCTRVERLTIDNMRRRLKVWSNGIEIAISWPTDGMLDAIRRVIDML